MLSPRLSKVLSKVNLSSIAADVGCDHGFLTIALLKSNLCEHVYATDISNKPLSRAIANVWENGLTDSVDFYCTNGLIGVPQDYNCVVIAGLGGDNIASILEKCSFSSEIQFVLQPMTHTETLREFLFRHDFCILSEDAVIDTNRVYTVMDVRFVKSQSLLSSCMDYYLPQNPVSSVAMISYYERLLSNTTLTLKNLKNSSTVDSERIDFVLNRIQRINEKISAMKRELNL